VSKDNVLKRRPGPHDFLSVLSAQRQGCHQAPPNSLFPGLLLEWGGVCPGDDDFTVYERKILNAKEKNEFKC
jgi:hypothetical protein